MRPLILRLSGDYAEPSFIIDEVPMLTANPMSDRVPVLFWATDEEEACVSDRSSAESEESTSGSNEPDTESNSSVSGMTGDGESSPPASPESPATRTFVKSQKARDPEDCERWEETDTAPTLDAGGHAPRTATMVLAPALTASMQNSKAGHNGMDDSVLAVTEARLPPESTSSAEGSPARTSASPGSEPDSCRREDDPTSSSSSCDSQMGLFQPEGMSSLRTYPDYFPRTVDEISPSFSRRWPNSGFTTSPTECLTADTSEFPRGGGESTSLADVLVADAASKYFLSPRAAAGILRRARKRGRTLPSHLELALERLASGEPTTPPTSAAPSSEETPSSEATE